MLHGAVGYEHNWKPLLLLRVALEVVVYMTSCTGLVTLSLFHRALKETEVKMVKR